MPFSLLHPGLFAFGIACVSIPIILHLLKRKRRPIPWGAMRFLEQAYRKRRRILTIEQLILLALRCILLSLIAMGAGSLMLGSGLGQTKPTTMVIVIDQSIGSAFVDDQTRSLDRNKSFALRALGELNSERGDRAVLISAGRPSAGLVMPESADLAAIGQMIEELEPSDSRVDLSGAIAMARGLEDAPDRPTRRVLVIAGDGRGLGGFGEPGEHPIGAEFEQVIAMPPASAEGAITNVGIIQAWATRSLLTQSGITLPIGVRVDLLRSGTQNTSDSTDVWITDGLGSTIGRGQIRWQNGQTRNTGTIAISAGSLKALIARTAMVQVHINDDSNTQDNTRTVAIPTRPIIRVGVIDQPGAETNTTTKLGGTISPSRWVRSALAPGDGFGMTIVNILASTAATTIPPRLDAIVVLAPGALDESAWKRIALLNESGLLVITTQDAQSSSIEWFDRLELMAPGLLGGGGVLRVFDEPMGLTSGGQADQTGLLLGISTEFDRLAGAVSVSRAVRLTSDDAGSQASSAMLTLSDGSLLAVQSQPADGRGLVVVFGCAFDLDWTNLPARAMFVPMMQEIVRQGVGMGSLMPEIVAGDRVARSPWVVSSHRVSMNRNDEYSERVDQSAGDDRAGVIAQLDAQGVTQGLVVINPDAIGAACDTMDNDQYEEMLVQLTGAQNIQWFEVGTSGQQAQGDGADPDQGTPPTILRGGIGGLSIALWIWLAAAIIAGIELVLAKLFTAKLFEAPIEGARR